MKKFTKRLIEANLWTRRHQGKAAWGCVTILRLRRRLQEVKDEAAREKEKEKGSIGEAMVATIVVEVETGAPIDLEVQRAAEVQLEEA